MGGCTPRVTSPCYPLPVPPEGAAPPTAKHIIYAGMAKAIAGPRSPLRLLSQPHPRILCDRPCAHPVLFTLVPQLHRASSRLRARMPQSAIRPCYIARPYSRLRQGVISVSPGLVPAWRALWRQSLPLGKGYAVGRFYRLRRKIFFQYYYV